MTILYKKFVISVTADNIPRDADTRLEGKENEKIRLLYLGIAPASTEDVFIQLYKNNEQLTGEGIYHSIVDDYTHRISFDAEIGPGEYFITKAWGSNARTIYGVYAYEIIS